MLTRLLVIAFGMILAVPAFAQDQARAKMLRTGATVEKLEGQKLTVKTDTGEELALTLPADLNVVRSRPATVADVKAGQFIGCTAVDGPNGKLSAREINILPESMRGVGEGHYPWGGAPKTTMTNGNIEHVAGITDGNVFYHCQILTAMASARLTMSTVVRSLMRTEEPSRIACRGRASSAKSLRAAQLTLVNRLARSSACSSSILRISSINRRVVVSSLPSQRTISA